MTNIGVPKLAYEIADQLGFKTIGFSVKEAYRVKCGVYPVDETIIVGEKFGDESEAFIEYIDILVRVGGGKQSRYETELFKLKIANQNLTDKIYETEVE